MRKIVSILLLAVLILSFGACQAPTPDVDPGTSDGGAGSSGQGTTDLEDMTVEEKVEYLLDTMTVEEKIAQMLILYYTKDTVDSTLLSVIREVKPGGFIMMSDNITTYEKTKQFVSTLQENSEIPMIISIDQEGGLVQRLSALTDVSPTYIPNMLSLGNTGNEMLAYQIGKVMAEEVRTIGVNVTFAPVVDILPKSGESSIGSRSFGKSAQLVSSMAAAVARGFEENGVIATYKHFPGHGDTVVDSHVSLPILNKSKEALYANELIPFQQAIANGAKIIMIGHLAVPEITGDNTPASLSKAVITDLLKKEMGYTGLVVTDALNMRALTNEYSYEEIYVKAIEAGVDLLLMPNGSRNAVAVIKANVSEERIDESVRKILYFKYTYLKEDMTLDQSYLGSEEHQQIVDQIP